ncbi:hypothetical protein HAX54_001164, partial [Datura stramonium]|nr:hypothetical protein [Datura stramonium]
NQDKEEAILRNMTEMMISQIASFKRIEHPMSHILEHEQHVLVERNNDLMGDEEIHIPYVLLLPYE